MFAGTFICLALLILVHYTESLNEYRVFNGVKVNDFCKISSNTSIASYKPNLFIDDRYGFLASLQYWHSTKKKFVTVASVTIISGKYGLTAAHSVEEMIRDNLTQNIYVLSNSPFSTWGTLENEQIDRVIKVIEHFLYVRFLHFL